MAELMHEIVNIIMSDTIIVFLFGLSLITIIITLFYQNNIISDQKEMIKALNSRINNLEVKITNVALSKIK